MLYSLSFLKISKTLETKLNADVNYFIVSLNKYIFRRGKKEGKHCIPNDLTQRFHINVEQTGGQNGVLRA